ncbi:CGH_1_collapsed_G0050630.mRNA.1.CDS.1 [Saccharomyces cerevisiae]|nr:CGH_1_collapsed_G0050630.mRNA.1.CDS.1 [Saccharomyces cerevisiae]
MGKHGYGINWLRGPYPDPLTGIDSDVPLAEHGVQQAKELAHYLLSLDNQPEAAFASPFYRCLETVQPIAKLLEIPVYLERGIGEWYRPDRKPVIPVPAGYEILSKFFPGVISQEWDSTLTPNEKGETEQEMYMRFKKFWPLFIERVEKEYPNVECILLVTHAASKIALGYAQYSGLETDAPLFRIGNRLYEGSWERLVGTELAFPNAAHVHKKTAGLLSPTEENETTNAGQSKGSSTANDPNIQIQEEDVGLRIQPCLVRITREIKKRFNQKRFIE